MTTTLKPGQTDRRPEQHREQMKALKELTEALKTNHANK
jgi:hypothetical protein